MISSSGYWFELGYFIGRVVAAVVFFAFPLFALMRLVGGWLGIRGFKDKGHKPLLISLLLAPLYVCIMLIISVKLMPLITKLPMVHYGVVALYTASLLTLFVLAIVRSVRYSRLYIRLNRFSGVAALLLIVLFAFLGLQIARMGKARREAEKLEQMEEVIEQVSAD